MMPYARAIHVVIVLGLLIFAAPGFANTIVYQYDALDRLVRAEYSDGTVIEYAYDEAGNRLTIYVIPSISQQQSGTIPPATVGTSSNTGSTTQ
jgi:YD repeat-containing protein